MREQVKRMARFSPTRHFIGHDCGRALYRLRNHPKLGTRAGLLVKMIADYKTDEWMRSEFASIVEECRREEPDYKTIQ